MLPLPRLGFNRRTRWLLTVPAVLLAGSVVAHAGGAQARSAQQATTAQNTATCEIRGRIVSGRTALPGVTVSVTAGEWAVSTSTDATGAYSFRLPPDAYVVVATLTGFTPRRSTATLTTTSCSHVLDLALDVAGDIVSADPAHGSGAREPAAVGGGSKSDEPRAGSDGKGSFESLRVQASAPRNERAETARQSPIASDDPAVGLLPPGFSLGAQADAVAVSGSLVELNRGQMNDRQEALNKGEFDLTSGREIPGVPGGGGNRGDGGDRHGGGDKEDDRRNGPGALTTGSNSWRGTASYTFGGSPLDAAPYALRGPQTAVDYLQQNVSGTVGGPLRFGRLYDGTGRTFVTLSYGATRNGNVVDQYATVPSSALRSGDFSASSATIVNPTTGAAFANNAIPAGLLSPAAMALLQLIPQPNLPGDVRNFRSIQTAHTASNNISARLAHRVDGNGLNLSVASSPSYRRTSTDLLNVFPALNGDTELTAISVPVTANWTRGRALHTATVTFNRVSSATTGAFAFEQDVAATAGISGVSNDPLDYGPPNITFSAFTGLRDVTPSRRTDRSLQTGYTLTTPVGAHTLRFGATYLRTASDIQSNLNPRGGFTFSGIFTGNGVDGSTGGGQDFADFLLGLPQQATRQFGQPVYLRGQQFTVFAQDDWRLSARWTINYGLQYAVIAPYREIDNRLVNLDANADFTAVAPVEPGGVGPFSGAVPITLIETDRNNLAPRLGAAWRATSDTVVRFGYGVAYNAGTYPTIALRLAQQPPYSLTDTVVGTISSPLTLSDAFANADAAVTNNFGIVSNYQLGMIQQWYGDYSKTLARTWTVGATYFGTRGSSLDLLRAPNRGPSGPRIPDVQAFTWETSDGASRMHGLSLRLERRQERGLSFKGSYTLARSRDNTTATSGSTTVAQNDQDLDAEWALSNFDRRHQVRGGIRAELPWGHQRRWFGDGGPWWSVFLNDWSASANVSWMSGMPLTVRCSACATDVAQGAGGTLRADYTGAPIGLPDPSPQAFFNTAAFAVPALGTFGTSGRNVIAGPHTFLVDAQITRDVTFGSRGLSLGVNVTNLFNNVNYGSVDTDVNSATFGQVMSVQSMRTVRLTMRVRF